MKPLENKFDWVWEDPAHLDAHIKDFLVEPSKILASIHKRIAEMKPEEKQIQDSFERKEALWFHRDIELSEPVGWTGLRNVCVDGTSSFWGYRSGRTLPSHLCLGEKKQTTWLCLWGRWEPDRFIIHTMYPGRIAPREIHDPELQIGELQNSIDFWRCHAIVVTEGEFSPELRDKST